MPSNLRIDPQRLWATLMETAAIGGTPKGGINRLGVGRKNIAPDIVRTQRKPREIGRRRACDVFLPGEHRRERGRKQLRQMRHERNLLIVLDRIEDHETRPKTLDPSFELRLACGQHVGPAAKQIGIGVLHPSRFLARHGVSADEAFQVPSPFADHSLGAARIGDDRIRLQHIQSVENLADGLRKIHEIGSRGRLSEWKRFIDDAEGESFLNGRRRADADDSSLKSGLAERQRKRAPNQADTGDRDRVHNRPVLRRAT